MDSRTGLFGDASFVAVPSEESFDRLLSGVGALASRFTFALRRDGQTSEKA